MSITCFCTNKTYTFEKYNDSHVATATHQRYVEKRGDVLDLARVNCLCGGSYVYSDIWHHLDRKRKHSDHQIWQSKQPASAIDDVLIICYCGAIVRYIDSKKHRNSCPVCMEFVKNKK